MTEEVLGYDLFGQPIIKKKALRDDFIEPPFSVLDTKTASWVNRKDKWKRLGIKSEIGREAVAIHAGTDDYRSIKNKEGYDNRDNYVSIFDPVLCELMYRWFCDEGGKILDPFAGGSVRGIVAGYLGYHYTGIDLRKEQVESNEAQAVDILKDDDEVKPTWITGDSNKVLDTLTDTYDLMFTCPPYADLEVYSDLPDDLSNMNYKQFSDTYASIIKKSASKLKSGGYAAIVVGEIRRKDDKDGAYLGLVPMTIQHCMDAGLKFYNEAILLNPVASASMRAAGNMKSRKLVKIHQNVLVFKKA
jgi:DNA modification methylase